MRWDLEWDTSSKKIPFFADADNSSNNLQLDIDFVKEINSDLNDNVFFNKYSKSFSRKFFDLKKKTSVSYYPIKSYLQDITKIDTFIKNSYSMTVSSLNSRFNFF